MRIGQAEFGGTIPMRSSAFHESMPWMKPGTVVLHSRADDNVPFAHSEELVRSSGLSAMALVEAGSAHRLANPEPLDMIFEGV